MNSNPFHCKVCLISHGRKIKTEKDVKLHFANAALMLQDITLKDEYRKALEDSFDALLKSSTNTNALVDQVNKWCEEKTEGKIPEIIKSLDGSQKLGWISLLLTDSQFC